MAKTTVKTMAKTIVKTMGPLCENRVDFVKYSELVNTFFNL